MNVTEMDTLFRMELDKIDTLAVPNFRTAERELILNTTQDRFISRAYQKFEVNQDSIEALRTLVTTITLAPTSTSTNVTYFAIPADYMYLVRPGKSTGIGTVCGVGNTQVTLQNIQTTQDRIDILMEDPFHQPNNEQALMLIEGDKIAVYTLGLSVVDLTITYLREPLALSLSATGVNTPVGFTSICELPKNSHRLLVDDAIQHTLETIESPRYKTNVIENKYNN